MDEKKIKKIKELVALGKIEKAIQLLLNYYADDPKIDKVIVQSLRYKLLENEKVHGTISIQKINKELNLLARNILTLIKKEEEEKNEQKRNEKNSIRKYKELFSLSSTRIIVADILVKNYMEDTKLTISCIQKLSRLQSRKLIVDSLNEMITVGLIDKKKIDSQTCWILNKNGKQFFENFKK